MPTGRSLLIVGLVCIAITSVIHFRTSTASAVSSCSSTVDSGSIGVSTSTNLTFTVTNQDDSGANVIWVKISAPAGFSVTGGSSSGWSVQTVSGSEILFQDGGLGTGNSASFSVSVATDAVARSADSFTVEISDSAGGGNSSTCGGSNSVSIISLQLTSLSVNDVGNSSAKINWSTNDPSTSVVNYGTTSGYGTNNTNPDLKTSHSIELSGLAANTTYHFRVSSVDGSGNTISTGDNTFTTAKSSTVSVTTVTTIQTTTTVQIASDTLPPKASLNLKSKQILSKIPIITGRATDNGGVAKVEYSIDDGTNWSNIELSQIGSKYVNFVFDPGQLDDGTYRIRVKVTDSTGNESVSEKYLIVLDKYPPQAGVAYYTYGPIRLEPDGAGYYNTLAGLDNKVFLYANGGATKVDLVSILNGVEKNNFSLVRNFESGLWSGTVSFTTPGKYSLQAICTDDAGNTTKREISLFNVGEGGRVMFENTPSQNYSVAVYVYDPTTLEYILWNSSVYNQINPIDIQNGGVYSFALPPGKYYISASTGKSSWVKSSIFTLAKNSIVTANFSINRGNIISDFFARLVENPVNVSVLVSNMEPRKSSLIGQELEYFELKNENGVFSTRSIRGQSAIITLLSTLTPEVSDQINALEKIKGDSRIDSYVVMEGDSWPKINVFAKRGKYTLKFISDKDGQLLGPLGITSLPTHIVLDKSGVITNIKYGLLKAEEIVDTVYSSTRY